MHRCVYTRMISTVYRSRLSEMRISCEHAVDTSSSIQSSILHLYGVGGHCVLAGLVLIGVV